jgi:hypothetical protein
LVDIGGIARAATAGKRNGEIRQNLAPFEEGSSPVRRSKRQERQATGFKFRPAEYIWKQVLANLLTFNSIPCTKDTKGGAMEDV